MYLNDGAAIRLPIVKSFANSQQAFSKTRPGVPIGKSNFDRERRWAMELLEKLACSRTRSSQKMDAQRALLDELMGSARNLTEEERKGHREIKWDDKEVCGCYMIRFCPHDLFVNTRSDLDFQHLQRGHGWRRCQVFSTSTEWGATMTKLTVPADWKEWQIYLFLMGLFLASIVVFFVLYEVSDSFWNFSQANDRTILLNEQSEQRIMIVPLGVLNLSINDNNKTAIGNAEAIGPLIHVLETGSPEAKENSAATLFSLSVIEENKIKIGRSGAIKPLVDLLGSRFRSLGPLELEKRQLLGYFRNQRHGNTGRG
ncbi:hypothetical protein CASFOL_010349 [Castilleja foliolosa]|uniref:RING-type E3 ubiquitin transferase n=1 Tax=Castilleja foliolosa TaxID=1961234 RepID=A0ABD3DW37_9LAMI